MAAWIGVFRAYSEQVLSILAIESLPQTHQDTMMKLYNVLKSVLEDYRDTVSFNICITSIRPCISLQRMLCVC